MQAWEPKTGPATTCVCLPVPSPQALPPVRPQPTCVHQCFYVVLRHPAAHSRVAVEPLERRSQLGFGAAAGGGAGLAAAAALAAAAGGAGAAGLLVWRSHVLRPAGFHLGEREPAGCQGLAGWASFRCDRHARVFPSVGPSYSPMGVHSNYRSTGYRGLVSVAAKQSPPDLAGLPAQPPGPERLDRAQRRTPDEIR